MAPTIPSFLRWAFGSGLLLAMDLAGSRPVYADNVVKITNYRYTNAQGKLVNIAPMDEAVTLPIVATTNDIRVTVTVTGKQAGDTCPATLIVGGMSKPVTVNNATGGFTITIPANTLGPNSNSVLDTPVKKANGTLRGDDTNNIAIPPP